MKKILFFLILFFVPNFVYAKDLFIDELHVINGELSLPFDPYNTEYTVTLEETEFMLDFNYKVEEGIMVSLNNNHDLENDSVVTLAITKEDKKLEYHFHILKNETGGITTFKEEPLNNTQTFMFKYKIYVIPVVCFILILIVHRILFHKHKKKII